jgi:hypothetical protein
MLVPTPGGHCFVFSKGHPNGKELQGVSCELKRKGDIITQPAKSRASSKPRDFVRYRREYNLRSTTMVEMTIITTNSDGEPLVSGSM